MFRPLSAVKYLALVIYFVVAFVFKRIKEITPKSFFRNKIVKFYRNIFRILKSNKRKRQEIFSYAYYIFFIGILLYILRWMIIEVFRSNFSKYFTSILLVLCSLIILIVVEVVRQRTDGKKGLIHHYYSFTLLILILFASSKLWINLLAGIVLVVGLFVLFPKIYEEWRTPNWHILHLIFLIMSVLIIGLFFVQGLYGEKVGSITLQDCYTGKHDSSFSMNCSTDDNALIANHITFCELSPLLREASWVLNFTYQNGSRDNQSLGDVVEQLGHFSFVPPINVKNVNFQFYGMDSNDEVRCLDTAWEVYFPDYEEYKGNREKFVAYLFGLVGITLFSVPKLMINIKKISEWKNKRKKK